MRSLVETYKTTDEQCAEIAGMPVEAYKELKKRMLDSQEPLKEFLNNSKRDLNIKR